MVLRSKDSVIKSLLLMTSLKHNIGVFTKMTSNEDVF